MPLAKVDILDPVAEAFQQPQAGAVEQAGHQPVRTLELAEDGADLVPGQDCRQPFGPPAELPRDRVIALHARSLTFLHPIRYEPVTVTAPLPPVWG